LYPIFSTAYGKIEDALSKYEDAEGKGDCAGKDEGTGDLCGGMEKEKQHQAGGRKVEAARRYTGDRDVN